MTTEYTESEIQGLKAQEAKDFCIKLLKRMALREGGPMSAGEVQLQELKYELELKEAEAEDNRLREEHELRLKELDLQIEHEKTEHAKSKRRHEEVQQSYALTIKAVGESQEKLSVQLDRATRENQVKMDIMRTQHDQRQAEFREELETLSRDRDEMKEEIKRLAALQQIAGDIDQLRSELEDERAGAIRDHKQLDEQIEAATFEKQTELKRIQREHEIAKAELEANHRKQLLDANTDTADALLDRLGYVRIMPSELEELRQRAAKQQSLSDGEVESIRREAIALTKREFNLGSDEPFDVTELFYREKSLQVDNEAATKQIAKLETEVARMRTHIESESTRVASAIEAARTNIQNNIEPGVQR